MARSSAARVSPERSSPTPEHIESARVERPRATKREARIEATPLPKIDEPFMLGGKEAEVFGTHGDNVFLRVEGERGLRRVTKAELALLSARSEATEKAASHFDATVRAVAASLPEETSRHTIMTEVKGEKDSIMEAVAGGMEKDAGKELMAIVRDEAVFAASVVEARAEADTLVKQVLEDLGERGPGLKAHATGLEMGMDDMVEEAKAWARREDISVKDALRQLITIEAKTVLHSPEAIDAKAQRLERIDAALREKRQEYAELAVTQAAQRDRDRQLELGSKMHKVREEIVRAANEMALVYIRLHPGADRDSVVQAVQESTGVVVMNVGPELAGVKTLEELQSQRRMLEEATKRAKAKEAPEGLAEVLEMKAASAEELEGLWKEEPRGAKEYIKKVEVPKTEADIRRSADYVNLQIKHDELPAEERGKAVERLETFVTEAGETGISEVSPDLVAAAKLLSQDLGGQRQEAAEDARDEAWFATGDDARLDAIGAELGIGNNENVKYFWQEFQKTQPLLADSYDKRDKALANLTWEQFTAQAQEPKGLFARLGRGVKRLFNPRSERQALHEQMIDAMKRNEMGTMSQEDLEHRANRTRALAEKRVDRATRAYNAPRTFESPFSRDSGAELHVSRKDRLSGEESPTAEGERSDAARAIDTFVAQYQKTTNPEVRARMEVKITELQEKVEEYQEALGDFHTRTADDFSTLSDREALVQARQTFEHMRSEIKDSPYRDEFLARLKKAGVESFDDIVIAATNKRKFDRAWKAYTTIQQEIASGSLNAAAKTPDNRPRTRVRNQVTDRE